MEPQRFALVSMLLLVSASTALATGCEVYVQPPRRRVVYTPPPPPPPPPRRVVATRPVYVAPPPSREFRVRAVSSQPGTSALVGTASATPSTGSTAASPTCLDTTAAPVGDCAAMKTPDLGCGPAGAVAAQMCATFKTYFDPLVGAAAVSCMTSLTSKEVCQASQIEGCARGALAQACPDPTVSQLCQVAAGPCKISQADCGALLAGLNDQGKDGVARCVATGCTGGLFECIETLSSSASTAVH